MKDVSGDSENRTVVDESGVSRRRFIGTLGAAVGTLGVTPLVGSAQSKDAAAAAADDSNGIANGHANGSGDDQVIERMNECFTYRRDAAVASRINAGQQNGNGDVNRYSDYSGMYAKGLLHDALGIPNAAAAASLLKAMRTGKKSDFAAIIIGSPGGGRNSRLNGPQGAIAFDLQGIDSHATVIPPSPKTSSAQTAAEAIEHYWAGVLRDVPFSQYASKRAPLGARPPAERCLNYSTRTVFYMGPRGTDGPTSGVAALRNQKVGPSLPRGPK